MQQQQEGGVRFILAPDLQAVFFAARDFARRYRHRCVEASDFLLAIYYASTSESAQLLKLALRNQGCLDEAALKAESSGSADTPSDLSATAKNAFSDAAEGAMSFRGLSAPGQAIVHTADLAVALLNQQSVVALLKAAGLKEFELRHLEEAIKLQQKMPPQMVAGSAASMASTRLQ